MFLATCVNVVASFFHHGLGGCSFRLVQRSHGNSKLPQLGGKVRIAHEQVAQINFLHNISVVHCALGAI